MGQRTQIIIIKENNAGKKQLYGFHDQWGYGRRMYLTLMDLVIMDYNKDTFRKGYNFLEKPQFVNPNLQYLEYLEKVAEERPSLIEDCMNLDNKAIGCLLDNYCDNNNGAMVVYFKENYPIYENALIKVGFLLGWEEACKSGAFTKWRTPREYGKENCGSTYSDDDFIEMFEKFREYFDIELISDPNEE